MTSDIERAVHPIAEVLGGNEWWAPSAPEALDRIAGIADQTGQTDRVERLRLEVSRYLVGADSADLDGARKALAVLVELCEQVRASQRIY